MELVTQSELGRRLGVKRQTIQNFVKKKNSPIVWSNKKKGQSRLIKFEETKALIDASNEIDSVNRPNRSNEKKSKPSKKTTTTKESTEKEELTEAQNLALVAMKGKSQKDLYVSKLKQMEYEQKAGTLILKSEVKAQALEAGSAIKGALLSLAPRLAPRLTGVNDEFKVYKIIEEEVRIALASASEVLNVE